jgi:hypothetical protein
MTSYVGIPGRVWWQGKCYMVTCSVTDDVPCAETDPPCPSLREAALRNMKAHGNLLRISFPGDHLADDPKKGEA